MANRISRSQIMHLYRSLLRESQKFSNYNFKSYALRKVKDSFKENKTLTDPKLIKKEFDYGTESLELIRRQVIVGDLYKTEKLVIENIQ